jgi:hypothetical protein
MKTEKNNEDKRKGKTNFSLGPEAKRKKKKSVDLYIHIYTHTHTFTPLNADDRCCSCA